MTKLDPNPLFARAVEVAACPHLATCRAEMSAAKKAMPLALPSPDYVGPKYNGLLIIGGNPGIAHRAAHHANDAHMFALQAKIATGDQAAFDELMTFLPQSMAHWLQMVNTDGRQRMQYDIEEIAYIDIVKCATRPGGSKLEALLAGTQVLQRCWTTHTAALLDLLAPTHIVALWAPIISTLKGLGYTFPSNAISGHYDGRRNWGRDQRYQAAKPVFDAYYDR